MFEKLNTWQSKVSLGLTLFIGIVWFFGYLFQGQIFERYYYYTSLSDAERKTYDEWLTADPPLDLADLNVTAASPAYIKAQDDFVKFYLKKTHYPYTQITNGTDANDELREFNDVWESAFDYANSKFKSDVIIPKIYFPEVTEEFKKLASHAEYSNETFIACMMRMTYNEGMPASNCFDFCLAKAFYHVQNDQFELAVQELQFIVEAFEPSPYFGMASGTLFSISQKERISSFLEFTLNEHPNFVQSQRDELVSILESLQNYPDYGQRSYMIDNITGGIRSGMISGYLPSPAPAQYLDYNYPRLEYLATYYVDGEIKTKDLPLRFTATTFKYDHSELYENQDEINSHIDDLLKELRQ